MVLYYDNIHQQSCVQQLMQTLSHGLQEETANSELDAIITRLIKSHQHFYQAYTHAAKEIISFSSVSILSKR